MDFELHYYVHRFLNALFDFSTKYEVVQIHLHDILLKLNVKDENMDEPNPILTHYLMKFCEQTMIK